MFHKKLFLETLDSYSREPKILAHKVFFARCVSGAGQYEWHFGLSCNSKRPANSS